MGKIAFVFSGQGAQYPGMGHDIYKSYTSAENVFSAVAQVRPEILELCFGEKNDELNRTINTQPCVFAVDLACGAAMVDAGIIPNGVAGFSLGEMAAITFADILTLEDGASLVSRRAELMDMASGLVEGAMVAVMKMDPNDVKTLAEEMGVFAVNFNSHMQTAVSGEKSKIKDFTKAVKERKAVAVPIKVSGAFHTPYMKMATDGLKDMLTCLNVKEPKLDVYSNITGQVYPNDRAAIVDLVANQASQPVMWHQTILNMIKDGYDCFYEVGPGNTLANLIKKIAPEVKVFSIEKKEDIENVKE